MTEIPVSTATKRAALNASKITLEGLRDAAKAWEADGRDAWAELKRCGTRRLEKSDVTLIARQLHLEIENMKPLLRLQNASLGEFCQEAGLRDEEGYSKRLYRVTLPPKGDVEKRKLRAVAKTYAGVIAAIAKRNRESLTVVAERVLRGTSLHPMESSAMDELTQIQILLQGIVDQVDEEFGLFAKFHETAKLRAQHAMEGGAMRWPQYDLDTILGPSPDVDETREELKAAASPNHAYWPSDTFTYHRDGSLWWPIANQSMARQDDRFFFVPHVHLGAITFTMARKGTAERASELAREVGWIRQLHGTSVGWTPGDEWNATEHCPRGQTLPMEAAWQCHGWIVIYPSPDGRRLMPMLYIPWEEGGPFLLPLDIKHLRYVRDHGVWVGPDRTTGVIDHIKVLLTNAEGSSVLEELRRTSPWFDHNPFLAAKSNEYADARLLNEQVRRMYSRKRAESTR